jgi:hypothetical protein
VRTIRGDKIFFWKASRHGGVSMPFLYAAVLFSTGFNLFFFSPKNLFSQVIYWDLSLFDKNFSKICVIKT